MQNGNGVTTTIDNTKLLKSALSQLVSRHLEIGIPDDSPNNEREDSNLTNSQIGYIIEVGAPEDNRPASPFLVPGMENAIPGDIQLIKTHLMHVLQLKTSPTPEIHELLDEVGDYSVEQIKAEITTLGHVVTGQLRDSITYEIIKD